MGSGPPARQPTAAPPRAAAAAAVGAAAAAVCFVLNGAAMYGRAAPPVEQQVRDAHGMWEPRWAEASSLNSSAMRTTQASFAAGPLASRTLSPPRGISPRARSPAVSDVGLKREIDAAVKALVSPPPRSIVDLIQPTVCATHTATCFVRYRRAALQLSDLNRGGVCVRVAVGDDARPIRDV